MIPHVLFKVLTLCIHYMNDLSNLIRNSSTLVIDVERGESFRGGDKSRIVTIPHESNIVCVGSWKVLLVDNTISFCAYLFELIDMDSNIVLVPRNIMDSIFTNVVEYLQQNQPEQKCQLGLLTSGTTGTPKIVIHSFDRLHSKILANRRENGFDASFKNILCSLPLSFGHGLIGNFFTFIGIAEKIYIVDNSIKTLSNVIDLCNQKNIHFFSSVPSMWGIIATAKEGFQQEIHIGLGSELASEQLFRSIISMGAKSVTNFYGLTEMSNWIGTRCATSMGNIECLFSDGYPIFKLYSGTKVKIIQDAENGSRLTNFKEVRGELALMHPTMFLTYLGRNNRTEDVYYPTGDVVEWIRENERVIRLIGRAQNYVNRGGVRIHLNEIDSCLNERFGELNFISLASQLGQTTKITTFICSDRPDAENVVRGWVDENIQASHRPDQLKRVKTVPVTARGKIDYKALKSLI